MKRFVAIVILCMFCYIIAWSQGVGVGDALVNLDPSAILDVASTEKGMLIPRMNQAQRDAIGSPAEGLLIFQTDNDPFFYYYDGSIWKKLCCEEPCINSCTYTDDYSSSTGWTQIGTGVSIAAGAVEFNSADNFPDRRIYKPLGCSLADCGSWTADFDIYVSGQNNESHPVFGFTAGSEVPFYNYTLMQESDQDGVFVWMSYMCPTGDSHLSIAAKDGTARMFSFSTSTCIGISFNTTYYCRFQRTSPTNMRLSAFSDAGRTIHIAGSPIDFTIPSTITGLNYIQHSNYESQTTQWFSGTIDNTSIY